MDEAIPLINKHDIQVIAVGGAQSFQAFLQRRRDCGTAKRADVLNERLVAFKRLDRQPARRVGVRQRRRPREEFRQTVQFCLDRGG